MGKRSISKRALMRAKAEGVELGIASVKKADKMLSDYAHEAVEAMPTDTALRDKAFHEGKQAAIALVLNGLTWEQLDHDLTALYSWHRGYAAAGGKVAPGLDALVAVAVQLQSLCAPRGWSKVGEGSAWPLAASLAAWVNAAKT